MEKVRILIADDVKESVNNLKNIIEKVDNVEVIGIANDGQEEYNKIIELQPDLVFTDNQMPKMTGIEVIEKVNNEPIIIKKPEFVLVTGDSDYSIYRKAYELKINTIINKPYSNDKILKAISEYVNSVNVIENKVVVTKESFISKIMKKFIKRKR